MGDIDWERDCEHGNRKDDCDTCIVLEAVQLIEQLRQQTKVQPMTREEFFDHVTSKYGIDSVTAFEMYKDGCRFLVK